jgi:peptidyl-tRNA hydrolase
MALTNEFDRLYLAVRGDLSPGLAAAQAVHAAFQFATEYPSITGPWLQNSQYLVIVSVPDEAALIGLTTRALEQDLACSLWAEPDMRGAKTALAIQPGAVARRLCANLPLHGRPLRLAV